MIINLKKYEVSIILTLFNSINFFQRALNSVINQSFFNWELIIVDDGSVDSIEQELFPFLKSNGNFKYVRHSNRKHPLSLNTGLQLSSGKYITFLDSDDEYGTNHIEERVNYFKKNNDVDLIYSPATIIGDEKDFFVPDARDTSSLIHINECIIGGTLFGKREVFESLEGFKNIYSHDSEFYERAMLRFKVLRYDSSSYIYHRSNPDSVTNKLMKLHDRG